MLRRIFITIEYKGTNYKGWQIQKDQPTVQAVLTAALTEVCGHKITLHASGRTDEGVHAMGQTAHFDTDCPIPSNRFAEAANRILPPDIKILSSCEKDKNFHARFDVKKKTYLYRIYNSRIKSPLRNELFEQVSFKLNINDMKKACVYLLGTHDFTSFMASGREVETPVREIYSADITACGNEIYFEICGNGFLYNMVRIIAGTLIDIGRKNKTPEGMKEIIEGKNRSLAGKTAGACGLYLKSVEY